MSVQKLGDFTGLAKYYSKYRVGYSRTVLNVLLKSFPKNISEIDFLDIGAGTGIWTRMVNDRKPNSTIAVEPNIDMINEGIKLSKYLEDNIIWKSAFAEETKLPNQSADWITMASSFHWTNFHQAIREFHRILKPNGFFTALWNPRLIENNPLLVDIENFLKDLKPDIKRVSSGSSGMTKTIMNKLIESEFFGEVFYLESIHTEKITPQHYLGIWKSVNDVQVQLGKQKFNLFLDYISQATKNLKFIEADYKTRAWTAKKLNF